MLHFEGVLQWHEVDVPKVETLLTNEQFTWLGPCVTASLFEATHQGESAVTTGHTLSLE